MKHHIPIYTNSSLNCFRRCPREYYYRYVKLRRTKAVSHPLVFGKLMHTGLNAWWNYGPGTVSVTGLGTDLDVTKADELLAGYDRRWSKEKFRTIAVEKRFEIDCGPYKLAGSIDALAKENGRCVIIEHKTSSGDITPGSSYWDKVSTIDSQLSTYWIAAKELGYDVREVLYDVIHAPKSGPLEATPLASRKYTKKDGKLYAGQRDTAETLEEYRVRLREDIKTNPEWYYCRQRFVRLEDDSWVQKMDNDMAHLFILDSFEANYFPRNTGSCYQFGRKCDYAGVCSGTESIDNDRVFRTAETQHEELV